MMHQLQLVLWRPCARHKQSPIHRSLHVCSSHLLGEGEGGFKALLLANGDGLHQACSMHAHIQPTTLNIADGCLDAAPGTMNRNEVLPLREDNRTKG